MLSTKKLLYKVVFAIKQLQDTKEYEWKRFARTVTHPAGANYWNMGTFPAKSGYTRQVADYQTNSSDVVITGWYVEDNNVFLRTRNMGSSSVSVALNCSFVYYKDSNQWT